jgi:hypothetical protein
VLDDLNREIYGDDFTYAELMEHFASKYHLHQADPIPWKVWGPLGTLMVNGEWPLDIRMVRLGGNNGHIGILPQAPPAKRIAKFIRTQPTPMNANLHPSQCSLPSPAPDGEDVVVRNKNSTGFIQRFSAAHLISCVRGTRTLAAVQSLPAAMQDIGGIYPRNIQELLEQTRNSVTFEIPQGRTLERARIDLDLAAMLARRATNHELSLKGDVVRKLNFDASRQHGSEIYVAIEETVVNGNIAESECRCMPISGLQHGHVNAIDKSMELLHKIYLESGPAMVDVRMYCNQVTICHTDDGTEGAVNDCFDVLDHYMAGNTSPTAEELTACRTGFLFPNAIRSLAWNHIFDGAMRRALLSLDFYAEYNRMAADLTKFVKVRLYRAAMRRTLIEKGEPEHAKALLHFSKSFAQWRWGTSFAVSRCLRDALPALTSGFDANLYKGAEARAVRAALSSSRFEILNTAIYQLSADVDNFRGWGRVCSCHESECLEFAMKGKLFICPGNMKAMRCNELAQKLEETLRDLTQKSMSCPPSYHAIGIGHAVMTAYGILSSEFALKFDGLNQWPYIVWRVMDAAAAQTSLALYTKMEAAHRESDEPSKALTIARLFCHPGSVMCQTFIDHCEGRGLSKALEMFIKRWQARLDETPAERGHALVSKTISGASSSRIPWWSATERLCQNLLAYDVYRAMGRGFLFERFYAKSKCIWQHDVARARRLRPPKMTRGAVLQEVYNDGLDSLADWSSFKGMLSMPRAKNIHEVKSETAALKDDLLRACFRPGELYAYASVDRDTRTLQVDPVAESFGAYSFLRGKLAVNISTICVATEAVDSSLCMFEVLDMYPNRKVLNYSLDCAFMLCPAVVQRFEVSCDW